MTPETLQTIYHIIGVLAPLFGFFAYFMNRLDKKFEKIDERFKKIDERFEKIDERLEKIEAKFQKNNEDHAIFERKFAEILYMIKDLEQRMVERMNQMEIRLSNQMNTRFQKMEQNERDLFERTLYLEFKSPERDPNKRTPGRPRGRPPKPKGES